MSMKAPVEPKISYLGFTELIHFLTAFVLFLLFSSLFGILIGLLSFLGGFLLDGDHMFGYLVYIFKTRDSFNFRRFFKADYFDATGKIFIPLHSWELGSGLIILYFMFYSPIFLVLGISLLVHLIVDQLTNHVNFLAYFLIWRVVNKFDVKAVCAKSS